jgi:PAS domain S-box-containing protein
MIYRMSLPDGKFEYVNSVSEEITGYTAQEYYNIPDLIKKVLHPDWVEYFNKQWDKLLQGDMQTTNDYQIIDKTGKSKWLNLRNVLIKGKDGQPITIEGIVRDITEEKQKDADKENLISELNKALQEVKTLRGIIPICAHCHEIRDDKGSWNKLENYIMQHSEAQFSHGICEKCLKKHFPENADEILRGGV